MAGAKEIRSTIQSTQKTRKITRAMEMVAASKMRKTQERMRASKPYASKIYEVVKHLAKANSEYRHPFMTERPIKSIGFIVVTSDRGLCGGLNANLLRETIRHFKSCQDADQKISLCIIGRKGQAFFKRVGGDVLATTIHLGDTPGIADLLSSVKVMTDAFQSGKIDALYVVYNEFINTMTQKPLFKALLPLPKTESSPDQTKPNPWDYIYEPDAKEILDVLLKRYIELQVYQAVVENIACEQAAKMMAMKSATDNAGDLIKEFQLAYNKARQSAITQELAEIVGGTAALEEGV